MRKLSASAGLGLGRSGTEPLKLGLGGGGKESALKAVVKQLEETLKAKDAEAKDREGRLGERRGSGRATRGHKSYRWTVLRSGGRPSLFRLFRPLLCSSRRP